MIKKNFSSNSFSILYPVLALITLAVLRAVKIYPEVYFCTDIYRTPPRHCARLPRRLPKTYNSCLNAYKNTK